jgi:TonB-dependent Receptor Plug Domain
VVDRDVIENAALSGRNALYLAQLIPGVSGDAMNTLNFNVGGAGNISINGATPRLASVDFDGASALRTRSGGNTTGGVDVDAVQEIQVLTSSYSAEYGRASGGQIRVVTKGGGRDFHVNLFENVQNTSFNANDWSRNRNSSPAIYTTPATLHFNQFGYNISGPVYIPGTWNSDRSKLFFYFGQEYARYRTPASASMTVPSDAMRQGDFSQILVPNNPFVKAGIAIKDPTTGVPFAGNIIPKSSLSPNGLGLLKAYPANQTDFQAGFNWTAFGTNIQNQVRNTVAFDFNPKDRHQVRFRGQTSPYDSYNPFDGSSDRTPSWRHFKGMTGTLNYVWTITPSMVNEVLVHGRGGIDALEFWPAPYHSAAIKHHGDLQLSKRAGAPVHIVTGLVERKSVELRVLEHDVQISGRVEVGQYQVRLLQSGGLCISSQQENEDGVGGGEKGYQFGG